METPLDLIESICLSLGLKSLPPHKSIIGLPLITQSVKSLPAIQETQVRFLGWEDPLEKEMATHSSILAWRIPCPEEPGSYSLGGRKSWT